MDIISSGSANIRNTNLDDLFNKGLKPNRDFIITGDGKINPLGIASSLLLNISRGLVGVDKKSLSATLQELSNSADPSLRSLIERNVELIVDAGLAERPLESKALQSQKIKECFDSLERREQ
jgi:deoxyinosine 3'endonuclease (endonuclease V)